MRLALALVAMLAASAASWLPFSAFAADPDEAPPEPISREAQLRMAPGVVKIEAINRAGNYSLGSGVLIGPHLVVTNCHVTRNAVAVNVLQGGDRLPAATQAGDVHHDLCVLKVPMVEGQPVPLARGQAARLGQPVIGIGFSGGLNMQFTQGELESLYPLDHGQVIRSSNFFTSGASGGGLFDADGHLLGLMTFRLRGGEGHYFSVPSDWITDLIADPAQFRPIAPMEGRAFWELDAEHQAPFLRAASLSQGAQWQELARVAQRWFEDQPTEAAPLLAWADALEHLNDFAGAERALSRAVALSPQDAEVWWRQGRLLARMGRLEDARAAQARLQSIDPARARQLFLLLQPL